MRTLEKDLLVVAVGRRARRRSGQLARQLAGAGSDKEAILAELELERWLAECCQDCLNGS